MARLSPAQQAQLDQLQAQQAEPEEGPKFSAREILHELASVSGRHNLHESIDALPSSYDTLDEMPEDEVQGDKESVSDKPSDSGDSDATTGTFAVDPNPKPKGV